MTRTFHRLFLISLVERNFFRSYSFNKCDVNLWSVAVGITKHSESRGTFRMTHLFVTMWGRKPEDSDIVTEWQKSSSQSVMSPSPRVMSLGRGRTVILCCSWNSPPSSLSLLTPTPHLSPLLPYSPPPVIPSSTRLSPSPSLRHIFSTHWTIQRQLISVSLFLLLYLLPTSLSLPLSQVL